MMRPDSSYLTHTLGLQYAPIGLHDLPTIEGIEGVVEKKGCLFSMFDDWQRGRSTHICRARPGCFGSSYWLCGAQGMPDELFQDFLVRTEGLKPNANAVQQFLAEQPPYRMNHRHLLIGPLCPEREEYLRTVTIYCNADQLSGLIQALFFLQPPGGPPLLLPSYGSGCLLLGAIFPDLTQDQAVVSSTDIAMRIHLPENILSLTVTVSLFGKLCSLDEQSLFGKSFWKRLVRHRRSRSAGPGSSLGAARATEDKPVGPTPEALPQSRKS